MDTRDTLAPHPVLDEYYADEQARRETVDQLFDTTAHHYDSITDIMSFGSGRWYREQALQRAGYAPTDTLLDVGCGTGVIAHLAQTKSSPANVVALDPSAGMLGQARERGVVQTVQGMGERLPFPDQSFDMLTMGYALRHVADLRQTFAEYHRVLRPGGRLLLLEISRPESKLAIFLLKAYMKGVVPNVARIWLRSLETKKLMRYYWDTIEACVPPHEILQALSEANFANVNRHVVMGIFSEYIGVRED